VTLVEKLVRCPSPSGQIDEITELLQSELQQRGFEVSRDEAGNVIGRVGNGPYHIYLVGHMDTVAGEIPVRIEENILHGRGSVDAKGSLAVFVEVAAGFRDSSALSLTVIGCPDEESDSNGAKHLLTSLPAPDAVIIGEPSGWDAITLGYKGAITLDYQLSQPGHHLGADELTAAEEAFNFYQQLRDSYDNVGSGFSELSINLKEINTTSDGLNDYVKMHLNIRTPIDFDFQQFERVVDKLRGTAQINLGSYTPAVLTQKNNALVRAFMTGIRQSQGNLRFKRKTGTSDMNLLQDWGCPIIAYGPGDSSLDHTPVEQLKLADYQRAIEILTAALKTLET